MCGIFGFTWSDKSLVEKCTRFMSHRGPDGEGYFVDDKISLGMRRLAIIDVEGGKQPVFGCDDNIILVFNGEIYNYKEIRAKLHNHRFESDSDTEVLVHAYEEWGEDFVKKLNGMYAIALWDAGSKKFFLIRDRIGIKPLYYSFTNGKLMFSSEIKAILFSGLVARKPNLRVIHDIFSNLFTETGETVIQGIYSLPPASFLVFENSKIRVQGYWDLNMVPIIHSEASYKKHLINALKKSVESQLVSDVPLGVCLSGGVDSGAITALASDFGRRPISTITVGFEDSNEFSRAQSVSEKFKTSHKEVSVSYKSVLNDVENIVWYADTIITRHASFPSYYLFREVRKHLKVVLMGDGGDELFAGYPRYSDFLRKNKYVHSFFNVHDSILKKQLNVATIRSKRLEPFLVKEIKYQLPEVHLKRVDTMSMANSVEARVPLLDHDFVSFSAGIPSSFKLRGDAQKYLFKKALSNILPHQVLEDKKKGMGVPILMLFKNGYLDFAKEQLLNIKSTPYFNYEPVKKLISKSSFLNTIQRLKSHNLDRFNKSLSTHHLEKLWFVSMVHLWHSIFIEDSANKFE